MAHLHLGGEHPHAAAARRGVAQAFWALVAGVVVAYVFFLALGAFGWGEAGVLTVAVILLALLWVGHAILAARADPHDPRILRQRERRGF